MKLKNRLVFLMVVLLVSASAAAQPAFDPDVDDVAPVPGIALALAVGLYLGVKQLRNKE